MSPVRVLIADTVDSETLVWLGTHLAVMAGQFDRETPLVRVQPVGDSALAPTASLLEPLAPRAHEFQLCAFEADPTRLVTQAETHTEAGLTLIVGLDGCAAWVHESPGNLRGLLHPVLHPDGRSFGKPDWVRPLSRTFPEESLERRLKLRLRPDEAHVGRGG